MALFTFHQDWRVAPTGGRLTEPLGPQISCAAESAAIFHADANSGSDYAAWSHVYQ